MVQRKVTNKLGIQADHVKSEKLLASLKPSSLSQQQDGKNKGPDLKKKMKKSRSFKRSELESLQSPNLRRQVPQPGKPPPSLHVPTMVATQQKQSPTKALDASPNYMKSTSSSDAKKERLQVSPRNSQTGSNCKSPSRKHSSNSKLSSGFGSQKPSRTLARTSSLELVRTLTRTPSFKPARASSKKCSPVVLCENLDVQRATCSSTLKDSKFPAYLALNPGGTESDGTSVFKVCPYTYCSLNGHHHTPLPPLKRFLSARRRMLKTKKNIKLGCLPPRRARALGNSMKEIYNDQAIFDERPALQEMDMNGSDIPPLIRGEQTGFFIEIYAKDEGNIVPAIDGSKHEKDDQITTDSSANDIAHSVDGNFKTAPDDDDDKLVKSLTREPVYSNIDFQDFLNQKCSIISTDMKISESIPAEDPNAEMADLVLPLPIDQEETITKGLSSQHSLDVGSPPRTQADEPDSEACDIDWEAEPHSSPFLDGQINGSDLEKGDSKEIGCNFYDEPIFEPDDTLSSLIDIQGNEMINDLFDGASVISEALHGDSDTESEGSYQDIRSTEAIQGFDNQGHLQVSPAYDSFEEPTFVELSDEPTELDECLNNEIILIPHEDAYYESKAAIKDMSPISEEDNEARSDISTEEKALNENEENESPPNVNTTTLLLNQGPNYSCNFTEKNQNEAYKHSGIHRNVEPLQFDAACDRDWNEEVFDGSPNSEGRNLETDQICIQQEYATATAEAADGTKNDDAATSFAGSQNLQLLQGFSKIDQQENIEDYKSHQLGAPNKESESTKLVAGEGLPAESQDPLFDEQSNSNNVVEDEDCHCLKKDQDESMGFIISNSRDSEDQNYLEIVGLRSADIVHQCADQLEAKLKSTLAAEETCLLVNIATNPTTRYPPPTAKSNSSDELNKGCKNQQWARRCKRPDEESEELKYFNPREPNYLPLKPDPEAEKVDLRHQMMDDRKNAEEWMLDYALRQAVTKLEPARKRKVALLVEAFETVMPIPKWETRLRHASSPFAPARPIQACS